MPEAALLTGATQAIALLVAALPANLKSAGVWGLLAVIVGLMLLSLVTSAFQRTSSFLLWHTWPALLLLLLQSFGVVPSPPPVANWTWPSLPPPPPSGAEDVTPQDSWWA